MKLFFQRHLGAILAGAFTIWGGLLLFHTSSIVAPPPVFAQFGPPAFTFSATGGVGNDPAFTATGAGPDHPVFPTQTSGVTISSWEVWYYTNGAPTSVSIQLEGAADSNGSPTGSYTALTAATTPASSSNPATNTTSFVIRVCCDYYPHVRLHVTTLSGGTSPVIFARAFGYAGVIAAAGGGGGGGGSGLACLNGDVTAGTGTCTTATVIGIDSVPLCSGYSPSNGQFVRYTTGSSPNPCYTSASVASGSILGSANWNISGGSITNLATTGVVSTVTLSSTGLYTIGLSGAPSQYAMSCSLVGDNQSDFPVCFIAGTSASVTATGFPLATVLSTGSSSSLFNFSWDSFTLFGV